MVKQTICRCWCMLFLILTLELDLTDSQLHSYVLPIMQGHYQISQFHIPREPVANETGDVAVADYIVISRRSRDRAGLRYQRRGIDENAHVANFVESESIMRVEREGFVNVFSYVQIRGSSTCHQFSFRIFRLRSEFHSPALLDTDSSRSEASAFAES